MGVSCYLNSVGIMNQGLFMRFDILYQLVSRVKPQPRYLFWNNGFGHKSGWQGIGHVWQVLNGVFLATKGKETKKVPKGSKYGFVWETWTNIENIHRSWCRKYVLKKVCLDFHRKELEKRQRRKKKASKSDQGKSQASYEYILSVSPFFPRIKRKSCEISKKECEPSTNQQNNTHQNR